jgi:excinuclease ABC subunit A
MCCHRLVDEGNTVIVIEHNLSVIAEAITIVEIGPEAGADGGDRGVRHAEEVAKNRISRTAPFLRETLMSGRAKDTGAARSRRCLIPTRRGSALLR